MKTKFTIAARLLAPALVALLLVAASAAQSFRGTIRGKVLDPTGSLIAGAKITAKNSATGLSRETVTGPDGGYVLAELPVGTYAVMAAAAGLTPTAQNVIVNVGVDTTADFDLSMIERRKEQLTVEASAPLVDAERDVLGEVLERRLVTELPLNGRDFGKLVALVPGTTVEPSGVAAIQSGFGQFAINGNRDRSNNYALDGTDNNDPFFNNSAFNQVGIGGAPASLLPIDGIQEFNLQSNFSAEYGRNSGSIVNIISRSGTNQFHGSGFEFLRNDAMDARNFFNRDTDPFTGESHHKSPFRNNNFGASVGGPIIKDKTFFFGAYEGQRERVTSDFTLLVPTQQQILDAQQLVIDNGVEPNPALTSVLGFYPTSTSGIVPGQVNDKNDVDSFLVKVDHQVSSSQSLTGRYAFARSEQEFPLGGLGFGGGSRLSPFAQVSPTRVQLVSASWLSTIGPTKINEIRFGYSRYRTSFSSRDANFDPNSLGIDFGTGKLSLPEFDFGGVFENLGSSAFSIPRGRTSQSYQILDNFTWVRGRHTIKFGGEFRRASILNFNDNLERGLITFSPDTSVLADCPGEETDSPVCSDSGAVVLANFYLGSAFTLANAGNTHRNTSNNGFSAFVQDDFRLRPNFTLNVGLRWEYFGPLSEEHDLISNLGSDGQLAMVGSDGLDRAYNRDWNNIAPRIGFAWNVHPNTVVRAGYGVYFDYIPQNLMIANFTSSAGLVTNPIGPQAVVPLNFNGDALSGVSVGPVFTLPDPPYPPFGANLFITPRDLPTPYVQSWNVNVEHELTNGVAFQIGYVGSKGTKLARLRDANQPDVDGNRVTFPQYGFVDEFATISGSTYHAMQATFRTQTWHGLSGFAGYTWSKSLDDASDAIDFNFATVAFPQDSNNLAAEHGPSNFDTRHRFTAAFTYQVPKLFGPKRFAEGWAINTIITAQSGRPVPIVSANDTSAFFNDNFNTRSNFHQRPNVVAGVNPINSNWDAAPDFIGYLNGAAFEQPADGTFGNLGRNAIFGPKFWNVDFSLSKSTQIFDRLNLQFRAEFFNIFNHPNFALPNFFVDPGSTQQGLITQTPDQAQTNPGLGGGGPRVVQLGVKLIF